MTRTTKQNTHDPQLAARSNARFVRRAEILAHSRGLMRGLDVAVLVTAAPLGLILRLGIIDPASFASPAVSAYMAASIIVGLILWVGTGLHRASWVHASWRDLALIVGLSIVTPLLASLTGFFVNRMIEAPRSLPLFHGVGLTLGLCAIRVASRQLLAFSRPPKSVNGFARADILLIGRVDLAVVFIDTQRGIGAGLSGIAGLLTDDLVTTETLINSIPVLGRVDTLAAALVSLRFHGVHVRQLVLLMPRSDVVSDTLAVLDQEGIEINDFYGALVSKET